MKRLLCCAWILVLGALLLGPVSARAEDSRFSLAATLGPSELDAVFGSRNLKRFDEEDQAAAVLLDYRVTRFLSIEAGLHELGSYQGAGSPCREDDVPCIQRLASLGLCVEGTECVQVQVGLEAEVGGVSLSLVPRWPLGRRLALRGRAGLMAWQNDLSGSGIGRIEELTGEDLLLGAGVEWSGRSGLGARVEYSVLELDLTSAVAGISWRF